MKKKAGSLLAQQPQNAGGAPAPATQQPAVMGCVATRHLTTKGDYAQVDVAQYTRLKERHSAYQSAISEWVASFHGADVERIHERIHLIAYSPAKEGATTPPTVVGERQDSSTTPEAEVHLSSGSRQDDDGRGRRHSQKASRRSRRAERATSRSRQPEEKEEEEKQKDKPKEKRKKK